MKKAFENAATRMAGKVIFMEVECSASGSAQEFCTKHNVDGYPTLKLMGGKLQKALFFERDRSVQVKTNEREGGGRVVCWRVGRVLCAIRHVRAW